MRCPRCNQPLYLEEELNDYPLWCEECDENFFIFEGIEDWKGESKELYKIIDNIQLKEIKQRIDNDKEYPKDIREEKYDCIQSVPPRFREDAYDCLEYSEDWKTIRKSWEYFLDDIINEMDEQEKKDFGFN